MKLVLEVMSTYFPKAACLTVIFTVLEAWDGYRTAARRMKRRRGGVGRRRGRATAAVITLGKGRGGDIVTGWGLGQGQCDQDYRVGKF